MISVGIDLAKGKTGLVALDAYADGTDCKLMHEAVICPKEKATYERYRQIAMTTMTLVGKLKPDIIVIEGYSFGFKANPNSSIPLCEVGGIVRLMLHIDGHRWLEPSATQVKKFTTDKGNSPKDAMMMEVLHRWGHKSMDNNTADAYACAMIGLAYKGRCQLLAFQKKIVGELTFRA